MDGWLRDDAQRVTDHGAEQLTKFGLGPLPATQDLSQDADQIARIGRPGPGARPA